MIGWGQGTQTGKSSSGALEAPSLEINTFMKRIAKEQIGFGSGAQIEKSSSRALDGKVRFRQ